jgi:hypothetical protein
MQTRKTIGVRLYEDELTALRTIADREDRDVRRQAARLIRTALVQSGALGESTTATGSQPASAVLA